MTRSTAVISGQQIVSAGIFSLAAWIAVPAHDAAAQGVPAAVTCTNPVNGAQWRIAIDYGKRTVDSYPANITSATISWFDVKDGGNYTLERQSGNLTATIASSTGGHFRRSHCTLPKPQ